MNTASQLGVGNYITSRRALNINTVTAGGGADNVAQNGIAINRLGFLSMLVNVLITAALASAQSVAVACKVQDSADGSTDWQDLAGASGSSAVSVTVSDGADENGLLEMNVNLAGARKFVRIVVTPNCSAANTDTATIGGIVNLGGSDVTPV